LTTIPPGQRRAFDPQPFTLSNGLRVILVENHTLPSVSMILTVHAGARTDTDEFAGTAFMAGRLLDEGTQTRSSLEIADAIESVGGAIDCESSHDRTTIYLSVLGKDLELGIELVADITTRPAFPEEHVINERERMMAEIRSAMDRPQVIAGWEFNELVYRGHPLHRPVHGYPETIERIERRHLATFHRIQFVPGNAILSAVGDFTIDDMLSKLEAALADWKSHSIDTPEPGSPVRQADVRETFVPISSQQSHVYFGHLGIRRVDVDYYTLQLMDAILGAGAGLTSRIPRKLRDEQGLAYTTFASIASSAGTEPGKFVAYIGTSPKNVEPAMKGFFEEIDRIRIEPVDAGELNDAKAYLTGSFVFAFESNSQIARFLVNAEIFGLGFDYAENYPKYINGVSAADITRAAREHLSTTNYSLVIAGPESTRGARGDEDRNEQSDARQAQ
jgi:zinc protease